MSYKATILAESGLQSLWMLDEASGASSVADSLGTVTGTPASVTFGSASILGDGSGETCAVFDGSSSRISFGDVYDMPGSFTMEAVVTVDSISDGAFRYFGGKVTSSLAGYYAWVTNQVTGMGRNPASLSEPSAASALVANTPFHLAYVYDAPSGNFRSYVNGVLKLNNTTGGVVTLPDNAAAFVIGDTDDLTHMANWKGKISGFAIYNVALSQPTLAAHYTAAFTPASLQYARPSADAAAGGWTPSTGTSLFSTLDETSADDADYISATAT